MISRRSLPIALAVLPVIAIGLRGGQVPAPIVTPFKTSGIYGESESAGWKVTFPAGTTAKYTYSIKENNSVVLQSVDLTPEGTASLETILNHPGMLCLQITPKGGGRGWSYGAAVAPTKLKPVIAKPKDFFSFWHNRIDELHKVPENARLVLEKSYKPDVAFFTIQMDHVNNTHVYGHLAKPAKAGKYPALLILQWASPPYPLQNSWVIERAAEGWLTLNIEPHDVLPDGPPSYYQGLPTAIKSYASIGQEDRDRSYFVEMYLRDYRAVDYLTHCPDWDGKTIVVMGTSMGGQQSLCVAGLHPKVTHVIVEEPAGCDMNAALHGRQQGYPNFPPSNAKVMAAAQYVDPINFASHIRATSLVAMGFVDTIAPPTGIWTAFNQIRGPKEAAPMPEAPHNNTATQEQQLPYFTRATAWLNALVKGQKVEVKKN